MNGDFTFQGNWWLLIEDLPIVERNQFIALIVEYGVTGHATLPAEWESWKFRTFDVITNILDRKYKTNTGVKNNER